MDEGAASSNANEVLMLRAKLKTLEDRTVIANKSVLEAEKERDKLHKELEFIEVHLEGKRAHTHDDTCDGHDMYAEVDEWDLRDFRWETTRVQNRRNVTLGSLHDQPKPRTGKDGYLLHVRLGLVGWIVYWCNGDSALTNLVKHVSDETKNCRNEQQRVEFHIAHDRVQICNRLGLK